MIRFTGYFCSYKVGQFSLVGEACTYFQNRLSMVMYSVTLIVSSNIIGMLYVIDLNVRRRIKRKAIIDE